MTAPIPDLTGLSPRKAAAIFTEWLARKHERGELLHGEPSRLAERVRLSLNEIVLNQSNPDALASSQKFSAECMAQFTEAWNAAMEKEKSEIFLHFLDKPDACEHDFQGWREIKCEPGQGGGGEQVCTKCGMGAMHYSFGRLMMTLFWHPTGPFMKYDNGILLIEDLNPQMETKWRMSRMEMLSLGWRCILSALRPSN